MFRGGLDAARVAGPACLLVLVALAGCAQDAGVESDDDGSLKAAIVDGGPSTRTDEDAVATTGRVQGVVLHPSGFPLSDARVTVLSVDSSVTTGRDGAFAFDGVEAGKQVLRVEKETYKTLQKPFEVVAGKVSKVEVVLTPADQGDFAEHTHNHWRGSDTFTVFEDTLKFADDIYEVPPDCVYGKSGTHCYYLYVVPEEEHIVPPGTSKVVVDLEFEPGPFFEDYEYMYFYIYPPRDAEGEWYYLWHEVESGSERIEYELPGPRMYDHGHARWTDWQFQIYWYAGYGQQAGAYYNHLFRSPVDVTITAHKGELELDPPHERYWADGDRLSMEVSDPSYAYGCYYAAACSARSPNPSGPYSYDDGRTVCWNGCMGLRAGNTVPPGTTRVEFTVEHYWDEDGAIAPQAGAAFEEDEFVIGYKTAAAPPHRATWDDYTWLEPKETTEEDDRVVWKFEVDVAEQETDPHYQKTSNWILMPAVRGHEDADTWEDMGCSGAVCGHAYFHLLEFTAINDDWDEMLDGEAS